MTMGPHLERWHDRQEHISPLELGTVIGVNPIQISLDIGGGLTLDFSKGDFVINDLLLLKVQDRVVVSRLHDSQLFVLLCRIGGKVGKSAPQVAIGNAALAQPVVRSGDVTGGASAGTAHTHPLTGTSKVSAE